MKYRLPRKLKKKLKKKRNERIDLLLEKSKKHFELRSKMIDEITGMTAQERFLTALLQQAQELKLGY